MPKFISVIVPCKKPSFYLRHYLMPALKKQTFKNFELIIVPDKDCPAGPAGKRDFGAKKAEGEILAFIDDDAYPHKNWLKNALSCFKNPQIAAVCGPGLTPADNNWRQKASGWVWQSWLGAGAAGTYRSRPEKKRLVDDYPSFNLLVRKKDFQAIAGFDSHYWPGEDTKLCHDLVYKLNKKIIYDPRVLVYHHRRPIFFQHLKQISRIGIHRGHFCRILPKTSLRISYFLPALFVLGLTLGWLLALPHPLGKIIYLTLVFSYFLLVILTACQVLFKEKSFRLAFFLIPAIFLTHVVYGFYFIKGLLTSKLKP